MNPKIKYWIDSVEAVTVARRLADFALLEAETAVPPPNLRPATASDIREGVVLWYVIPESPDGPYWKLVEEVLRPNDPWKAYTAHDGCRYGLEDAMVEVES